MRESHDFVDNIDGFNPLPAPKVQGDAGCCNQRNTKRLHRWMREPPFLCILWLKRARVSRCKLLFVIGL